MTPISDKPWLPVTLRDWPQFWQGLHHYLVRRERCTLELLYSSEAVDQL